MSDHLVTLAALPATSHEQIEKIRRLEEKVREAPQCEIVTEHVFHAGMYARTVRMKANIVFTSALIKRATLLIANGDLFVMAGEGFARINGYNVIPAAAMRKQVYVTAGDVELTMIFPTEASTVEEAEAEFTDETDTLLSRTMENDIVSTENPCLESQPLPRS